MHLTCNIKNDNCSKGMLFLFKSNQSVCLSSYLDSYGKLLWTMRLFSKSTRRMKNEGIKRVTHKRCVYRMRLSGAFIGCVCRMRLSDAFVGCVYRMRLSDAFIGCVYRMRLSDAFIRCVYRMRLSDAFIGCVYRMRLSWSITLWRIHP